MASKSIGKARIDVVASAAGMKKGNRDIKRETGILTNTLMSAKSVVAGFVGVYTAKKIYDSLRDEMRSIDDVAKKSRKLGMATEELIALRHAAEQSGIGVNTFDMAMQRMTRRMAEAARDTGEAKDAIAELGLDPVKLSKQSPAKALDEIADAMQRVESPSDRLRLAFKLFDSEGAALVNMLGDGSKGLREFKKEAEDLGILFSAKEAAQVEAANDAIDEMGKTLRSIGKDIVIEVAPAFKMLAETIRDVREASGEKGVGEPMFDLNRGRNMLNVMAMEAMAREEEMNAWINEKMGKDEAASLNRSYAQAYRDAAINYAKKHPEILSAESRRQLLHPDNIEPTTGIVASKSIEIKTDPARKAKQEIQDELSKAMFGEFEHKLKQLKDAGANPAYLKQLRIEHNKLSGYMDAKQAFADIQREEEDLAKNDIAAAQRIRDGMKTENDILRERIAEIEHLWNAKQLTDDDAKKALAQVGASPLSRSGSNTGEFLQMGSREAYNAIVTALSRDPEKQDERLDRKAIRQAAEQVASKIDKVGQAGGQLLVKVEDF